MTIEIGKKFSVSEIVTPAIVASTFGSGALPVFATPYLIALMEHAAFACLQELLDEGQGSVGTHLNVSHESPTPIGMTVRAEATITAVNGKLVEFDVVAYDEVGLIGRGTHQRAIISNERFLAKCNGKTAK